MSPPDPFTHKTVDRLCAERILHLELGRGVTAAKVGNALVGSQEVRAVQEQFFGRELRGVRALPAIFDPVNLNRHARSRPKLRDSGGKWHENMSLSINYTHL